MGRGDYYGNRGVITHWLNMQQVAQKGRNTDYVPRETNFIKHMPQKPYETSADRLGDLHFFDAHVHWSGQGQSYCFSLAGINNKSSASYEITGGEIKETRGGPIPAAGIKGLGMSLSERARILDAIAFFAGYSRFTMVAAGKSLYRFIAPGELAAWLMRGYDAQETVFTPGIGVKAHCNAAFISMDGERIITARQAPFYRGTPVD
ncbi:MAG: hypothetical protein FWF01_02290, partial [Alphaproteobacteria bacterium]|nr:hypothetical protein [Alphaproteobacteria bacterium]